MTTTCSRCHDDGWVLDEDLNEAKCPESCDAATRWLAAQVDTRKEYTAGLRQLADWLDAHPDIELPWTGTTYDRFQLAVWTSREQLAAIAKALPGKVEKDYSVDSVLGINAQFGALHVKAYAGRNQVCDRVVVGTETVTVPAVEAKPETTEERDVVEWRCHPLLADDTDQDEQVSA